MKRSTWKIVAWATMAICLSAGRQAPLTGQPAVAQNLGERTVSGAVLDADGSPVVGATVFLKSEKTKLIRSFSSVEKGHYQFAQVHKNEDFDLWAEKDGKKSPIKPVSSWDARTVFVMDLKLK